MQFQYHANLTLGALRRWLVAQLYDSLIVGLLWLAALLWFKVPWAPFWAILAAVFQFIPHFGPLLALIGPALAMLLIRTPIRSWLCFLAVYAAITVMDALLLQPLLMRRQNRVPFLASLFVPILLGIVFPFWGVLLAPPFLAIIYAYRGAPKPKVTTGEQKFSTTDDGIILSPENHSGPDE
jgi:predicted PurR-regulated permease PerM